jgi:hypothetical protein
VNNTLKKISEPTIELVEIMLSCCAAGVPSSEIFGQIWYETRSENNQFMLTVVTDVFFDYEDRHIRESVIYDFKGW